MNKIAVVSAVAGLGLLFSCKLDDGESLQPITSDVEIEMIEDLGSGKPSFLLNFTTENKYPCSNYALLMEGGFDDDKLDLTFTDVYIGSTCLGGTEPAHNAYVFGELEEGTYDISLKIKGGETKTGQVVVSDSAYSLSFTSGSGFEVINTHLFKMPKGIVWGTLTKNSNEAAVDALVDNFFELAHNNGLADTLLAAGDYTYFKVDDVGKVTKRRSSVAPAGTIDFVMYYTGNKKADLIAAIKDFAVTYQEKLTVEVYDWEGTIFIK